MLNYLDPKIYDLIWLIDHNSLFTTEKQIIPQPVAGKKAKIESLKIDNLMYKMQKVSAVLRIFFFFGRRGN